MSLSFDLQNSLVIIDNAPCIVNQEGEFHYNDKTYIVYYTTLSTRTHFSVFQYADSSFKVPAVILKSDAIKLVQYFVNLAAHSVTLTSLRVTGGFGNTLDQLKNELLAAARLEPSKQNVLEKALELLGELVSSVNAIDYETGLRAGRPLHIYLNTQNQALGVIMEQLFEFFFAYTSYAEETINYHALNSCNYILYSVIRVLFLQHSRFQSDLFATKTDVILHYFVCMLVDLVTDKCGSELYIKRRHPQAADLMKRYHAKYPILGRILHKSDVAKLPKAFFEESSREPIRVLPYLAAYNMPSKERILFVYETLIQEYTKHAPAKGVSRKVFSPDELWAMLENLTRDVRSCSYSSDNFMALLPNLLSVLRDNQSVHPAFSELLTHDLLSTAEELDARSRN